MIKLSTAILLLLEVEPLVCSLELNLSEVSLVLLVPYFDLYLSAMLEFCRIYTRFQVKREKKNMFQARQRTSMETFYSRDTSSTTCM